MMSIRLRFTLLYSAILAVTLAIFSLALYSIQAQTTLDALKADLVRSAQGLDDPIIRSITDPNFSATKPPREPPPPIPFANFSPDQTFQDLPEREIVRLLDSAGNLVASPFGRSTDTLPLSAVGLETLQSQVERWETGDVQDQRLLIYNRPIVLNGGVAYILQVARSLTERDRSLQVLAVTLFVASLVTVLIAFGIGWAFSGITLKPIQRITQTARAIGAERDFSRRVAYTGPPDEVGQLATTFNSMLARLQDGYQRVAHSLEMQRNFVADVSHELRTPLTTLRGNLGLLRREPPIPSDERDDILKDMVDESDRLIRLVNDLLILARADAGRSLSREPFDISPLLEETCHQARQLNPQRKILLQSPAQLAISGDRDAFKQVLLNALDNALKHSTGDISVQAADAGLQVEIRIQDCGPGIPPAKLEHIFDRFYRGEDGAEIPGFGLGLSIAKALVEAQGGTIKMESELGKGSVLVLRFAQAVED
jgi:signal transduction histidine kinase